MDVDVDRVSASFGLLNLSPFMQEQQCITFCLSLECLDKLKSGIQSGIQIEVRFAISLEQWDRWYPRRGSNSRLRLRRPALYPLSYRGMLCPKNITLVKWPTSKRYTVRWWTNPDAEH